MIQTNKGYFNKTSLLLKKIDLDFLYHIPKIYKYFQRTDLKKNRLKNFFNLEFFFSKGYFIINKEKLYNSKIIFISHYVGNISKDKDIDFYYGSLFKFLQKKKINFSVILINHTEKKLSEIVNEFRASKISRVIVNQYSNPIKDTFNILTLIKFFFIFKSKLSNFKTSKAEKEIIKKKLNFMSFINSRTSYRLNCNFEKIFNIAKKNKKIIVTFEGHPFERVIFKYCYKNKIDSIAYFFSVIRENKTSVFFDFKKEFMPKVVFTTGPVIKDYFSRSLKKNKNIKIVDIGSTKFDSIKKNNKKSNSPYTNILICPEGFYSETQMMLDFSKKILENLDNIKIIFRVHPVININKLKTYSLENLKNKNFYFSKNSLENDLKKSGILLYRGSSVCVSAALNGVLPINLKFENEISLDPLFQINPNVISNVKDLKSIFLQFNSSKKKIKSNLVKIQNYCYRYYTNLKLDKLIKHLQ